MRFVPYLASRLLVHHNSVLLLIMCLQIFVLSRLFTRLHSLIGIYFAIFFATSLGFPIENFATEVSSRVKAGIDVFVPFRKYQMKPESFPWLKPACSAARAHTDYFFWHYQRDSSEHNRCFFVSARIITSESLLLSRCSLIELGTV